MIDFVYFLVSTFPCCHYLCPFHLPSSHVLSPFYPAALLLRFLPSHSCSFQTKPLNGTAARTQLILNILFFFFCSCSSLSFLTITLAFKPSNSGVFTTYPDLSPFFFLSCSSLALHLKTTLLTEQRLIYNLSRASLYIFSRSSPVLLAFLLLFISNQPSNSGSYTPYSGLPFFFQLLFLFDLLPWRFHSSQNSLSNSGLYTPYSNRPRFSQLFFPCTSSLHDVIHLNSSSQITHSGLPLCVCFQAITPFHFLPS